MRLHKRLTFLLGGISMACMGSAFASDATPPVVEGERSVTPPSSAVESAAAVDPTPGKVVALQQSIVFDQGRFIAVFGEEAIRELTESRGIDWELLSDASIPIETAKRRSNIRAIRKFVASFSGEATLEYLKLSNEVMRAENEVTGVPEKRMLAHARSYFGDMFPGAEITFKPKMSGDQLGSVVEISQPDGRHIKYYVKTHSGGLKSERSTAAKPVNAIELMVYKMLEVFGIGCESHFFGRDEANFYIATRDANELGEFKEYATIKETEEALLLVWGVLTKVLDKSVDVNKANYESIEAAIASDAVAGNFLRQISLLDILARLMLLTDLQTNGGNYGFVSREGALPELRVIDFRLSEIEEVRDRVYTEDRFAGLLRGNGFFNYPTADRAICYALRNRPVDLRVAETLGVVDSSLIGWREKIEHAKALAREGILSVSLAGEVHEKLLSDLEAFSRVLHESFAAFEGYVRGYVGDEKK